jgi:hypothetical protein
MGAFFERGDDEIVFGQVGFFEPYLKRPENIYEQYFQAIENRIIWH